jgi:hypothetical protein
MSWSSPSTRREGAPDAVGESLVHLIRISHSHWDTDTWNPEIQDGTVVPSHSASPTGADLHAFGESDGGFLRGCSTTATWELVVDPNDPTQAPPPAGVTFALSLGWPWSGGPTAGCSFTNSQFYCVESTETYWWILRGPVPCCPRSTTARRL